MVLCLAAGVLAGCGGAGSAQHATPAPALRNPLDFPLYTDATPISAKSFTQIVNANPNGQSVFAQGNGKYTGHEVIASSGASFEALSAWVDSVNASPPAGYSAVENQTNPAEQTQSQRYGLDYALFKKNLPKGTRGLLLIVMDPQRVDQRFGAVLGMIQRYRALPAVLRAPLDQDAKARFGMSITDATQPDSPIGAALAALGDLQHRDARGIILIDAQKQ
jgi:hypothetical protein